MGISCDAIHLKGTCGIYIIRNTINNKVYIGQSVDMYRRMQEHIRASQPEHYSTKNSRDSKTPIHLALHKYGLQNFTMDILEKCSRNRLDERERYWIAKFQSTNPKIGYNLTTGGQKNLGFATREKHGMVKLSEQEVMQIQSLLQTTSLSLPEIQQLCPTKVAISTLSLINTGKIWFNKHLTYPLRKINFSGRGEKNGRAKFTEQEVMEMRTLYSQGVTLKGMPTKFTDKASPSAISAILYGRTYQHLPIWNKRQAKWIEPCIDYPQSHKAGEQGCCN